MKEVIKMTVSKYDYDNMVDLYHYRWLHGSRKEIERMEYILSYLYKRLEK